MLVDWLRVRGIVAARERSGRRSWELSHLYTDNLPESDVTRLLERVVEASAARGAERIFLRLSAENDTFIAARRAGFYPCFREELYRGVVPADQAGHGLLDRETRLRAIRSEDQHDLFRLYNAATPVRVRQSVGMTQAQWADSRERTPGGYSELVLEAEGAVMGRLGISEGSGTGNLSMTLHPEYASLTSDLVDAGIRRFDPKRELFVLVNEDTPLLGGALRRRGFKSAGDLVVMVKTMAITVRERVPGASSVAATD